LDNNFGIYICYYSSFVETFNLIIFSLWFSDKRDCFLQKSSSFSVGVGFLTPVWVRSKEAGCFKEKNNLDHGESN